VDYALYLSFKWALIVHLAYFFVKQMNSRATSESEKLIGNDAEEVNSLKFCLDAFLDLREPD
jgi:hypothetical protein